MRPSGRYITAFESEFRAIAVLALSRADETGGDLYGLWSAGGRPVVYFATGPGPNAVHEVTHFGQDVTFLSSAARVMQEDHGLQYLGDWHSHHQLGLREPSAGDSERIRRVASRNSISSMAELIVSYSARSALASRTGRQPRRSVVDPQRRGRCAEITGFSYSPAWEAPPVQCEIAVLPGESPFRARLVAHALLGPHAGQEWCAFPMDNISLAFSQCLPEEAPVRADDGSEGVERALGELMSVLEEIHGQGVVEAYKEEFGYVVVLPVGSGERLGIAIEATLPFRLLSLYQMGACGEGPLDLSSQVRIRDAPSGPELFKWIHDRVVPALRKSIE